MSVHFKLRSIAEYLEQKGFHACFSEGIGHENPLVRVRVKEEQSDEFLKESGRLVSETLACSLVVPENEEGFAIFEIYPNRP